MNLLHAAITLGVAAFLLFVILGLTFSTPKETPCEKNPQL